MSCGGCKKAQGTWNDMEEIKYLLCAMECCKCPLDPPAPTRSIVLPPRVEELPAIFPPQRPCCPPPPICPSPPCYRSPCPPSPACCSASAPCCKVPIVRNPCCIPSTPKGPLPPLFMAKPCRPASALPCYPSELLNDSRHVTFL